MKKLIGLLFGVVFIAAICLIGAYFYLIGYHGKSEKVIISVSEGQTYSTIAGLLKEKGLIKSETAYKIYVKLNKPTNLEYGSYILNKDKNVKEIIKTLEKGSVNLNEAKMELLYDLSNISESNRNIIDYFYGRVVFNSDELEYKIKMIKNVSKEDIMKLKGKIEMDSVYFLKGDLWK